MEEETSCIEELMDFFNEYNGGKYRRAIAEMAAEKRKDIAISFQDLLDYKATVACREKAGCKWVVDLLPERAKDFLYCARIAVRNIQRVETPDYVLDPEEIEVKLTELPPEVFKLSIRDLLTNKNVGVGRLVLFKGVVKSKTEVIEEAKVLVFKCKKCGYEIAVPQEETGKITKPAECPRCAEEGERSKDFDLVKEKASTESAQYVTIMEPLEEVTPGSPPQEIGVVLRGSLVDGVTQGDEVLVTGLVDIDVTKPLLKTGLPAFRKFIHAINIEKLNKDITNVVITKDDEEKFLQLVKRKDYVDLLVNSFSPQLKFPREVKLGLLLLLFGCDSLYDDGGNLLFRGEIHALLVGDPSTGKSKLLETIAKIFPRSLYVSAKRASQVGLTAATVRDESGRYTTSAGVVVLADRGIACIDELDKVGSPEEYGALLEPMEEEKVTKASAAGYVELPAHTQIVAAVNPINDYYDPTLPFKKNVDLPSVLLSRFDMIFLFRQTVDEEKDRERGRYVMEVRRLIEEKGAKALREGRLAEDELRKLIVYARKNIHPKMTKEAGELLVEAWVNLRKKWAENKELFPFDILDRTLDSLERIAKAHARMHLRDVATVEDARFAEVFYNWMLNSILDATRPDPIAEVMKTIEELQQGVECVDVGLIAEKLEKMGIKREDVEKIIEKLAENGRLMEIRRGCVKKGV